MKPETDMIPKFYEYSEPELRRAAKAFVERLQGKQEHLERYPAPTWQWTDKIIDWWSWTAPTGIVVDAHPVSTRRGVRDPGLDEIAPPYVARSSECMLDLTHTRFEAYGSDYGTIAYWKRAYDPSASPELLLALESESGQQGAPKKNTHDVLEDASKLLLVAARVKVVVFASHGESERLAILDVARLMLPKDRTARSGSPVTWAWIDLPWPSWNEHAPSAWVGTTSSQLITSA